MPGPGGFIYALGAEGAPYVKIGSTSASVEKRMKELQTGHPVQLHILATVPVDSDVRKIETLIHRSLQAVCSSGEWFTVTMTEETLPLLVEQARLTLLAPPPPRRDRRKKHEPDSSYNIGARLTQAVERSGKRKAAIAREAEISWSQLSKLMKGERPQVKAETVRRLALALPCSADYLLGLTEEEPS